MKLRLINCFLCILGLIGANLLYAHYGQTSFDEAIRVSCFQFWAILTLFVLCELYTLSGGED